MSNYRRWRVSGGSYFFTVNLLNRKRALLVDYIDALRDAFRHVRSNHPYHIDAIVVLPDHLHCIWTLPKGDDRFSIRWQLIKAIFSRAVPMMESRSRSRRLRGERGIWQRRFWEHVLRDEQDYAQHVDYIHYNPVKHGLVAKPIDWPHSSLHSYVQRGVLNEDWGTDGAPNDLDLG